MSDQGQQRFHFKRLLKQDQISTRLDTLGWGSTHENDRGLLHSFARSELVQALQPIHTRKPIIEQDEMWEEGSYHFEGCKPILPQGSPRSGRCHLQESQKDFRDIRIICDHEHGFAMRRVSSP